MAPCAFANVGKLPNCRCLHRRCPAPKWWESPRGLLERPITLANFCLGTVGAAGHTRARPRHAQAAPKCTQVVGKSARVIGAPNNPRKLLHTSAWARWMQQGHTRGTPQTCPSCTQCTQCTAKVQHLDFPGGHPSQYYSSPSELNFGGLMGSGAITLV